MRRWFGIVLCALVLTHGAPSAPAAATKEYQIKASFLFNFAQFIEWPPAAFAQADTPFCIGVLGDDPFGGALEETVRGETIQARKMVIQRSRRLEDLKGCQLVFISKSEKGRLAEILDGLQSTKVVTVSETDGFVQRGGMINFILDGNKVRFEINPGTARSKGLKISSQLLSLGKIITTDPAK